MMTKATPTKIHPFPHRYTVTLENRQITAPQRAPIAAGPPPQFGGEATAWSPEDLLVGAVVECLWTTFEAYARHEGLAVLGWTSTATGILEKGSPIPAFSAIELRVEVEVAAEDIDHAGRLLETAEKRCIISNALKVPVKLEATVQAPRELARAV